MPEESAAVVPEPSSKVQWPTRPVAGAVTVRPVEPVIEPEVAWIVVLPAATLVASPVALMVAAAVFVDVQVTELVRFCVLLSL